MVQHLRVQYRKFYLFLVGSLMVNTNMVLSSFSPAVALPSVPNSFRAKVSKSALI